MFGQRKWRTKRLGIAVAMAAIALAGALALAAVGFAESQKISASSFHDGMRKLWEDHVTWTRLVIVDVAFGTADTQATLGRLLQNQLDIGNAIKPFYGDAAGNQLTALLTTHIVLAGNILVDAKAGNTDGVNANVTLWYQNANDIAAFLNGANPNNWPLADMQGMMKTHLDLTLQEAVAQLTGDYATSISSYDQVHLEILQMADMLSAGIIAQFPSMFTGPHAM
jgi:hypothetical protein